MIKKVLLTTLIILQSILSFSQDFSQRSVNRLAGDITFLGNNILVNADSADLTIANENGSMDYIDQDDADASISQADKDATFSSSSAVLDIPDCSEIVYAGLYWAGIYPFDTWESEGNTTNTNIIKFRFPGQPYEDVTGDLISNIGIAGQAPYAYYKDITTDVIDLGAAAEGEYYAGNIRGTTGVASASSVVDLRF